MLAATCVAAGGPDACFAQVGLPCPASTGAVENTRDAKVHAASVSSVQKLLEEKVREAGPGRDSSWRGPCPCVGPGRKDLQVAGWPGGVHGAHGTSMLAAHSTASAALPLDSHLPPTLPTHTHTACTPNPRPQSFIYGVASGSPPVEGALKRLPSDWQAMHSMSGLVAFAAVPVVRSGCILGMLTVASTNSDVLSVPGWVGARAVGWVLYLPFPL